MATPRNLFVHYPKETTYYPVADVVGDPQIILVPNLYVDTFRNTGFKPTPTAISSSSGPSTAQIGEGVNSAYTSGAWVNWMLVDGATIAVPDEMADIDPRSLIYPQSAMVFYGADANDIAITASDASGSLKLTFAAEHGLYQADRLTLATAGTLPTGLSSGLRYYVQSRISATEILVTASEGGSAIAYTDAGSGVHHATVSAKVGWFWIWDGNRKPIFSNQPPTLVGRPYTAA